MIPDDDCLEPQTDENAAGWERSIAAVTGRTPAELAAITSRWPFPSPAAPRTDTMQEVDRLREALAAYDNSPFDDAKAQNALRDAVESFLAAQSPEAPAEPPSTSAAWNRVCEAIATVSEIGKSPAQIREVYAAVKAFGVACATQPTHSKSEDKRGEAAARIVNAARDAMNASLDSTDTIDIPAHFAAALSLALDEYDAALATPAAQSQPPALTDHEIDEIARGFWSDPSPGGDGAWAPIFDKHGFARAIAAAVQQGEA